MSLYNIDYDVLLQLLIPKRLRGAKIMAWLNSLIAPIKTLYASFMAFKAAKDYELAHNSQVCYLEAVINDVYDAGLRRIKIYDTPDLDPTFYFLEAEAKPEYMYLESEDQPKFFYLESETIAGYDFEVHVPSFIAFDAARLAAMVNKYKLPGRSFTIKIV